ncbi:MAG: iron-sulfur cluster assembly scaffold protein [Sphingorhabdus sp.]
MAEALYTREILRLAMSLPAGDDIVDPDAEAYCRSPICGSEMTVQLALDKDNSIAKLTISAKACAMGQASAAILRKNAPGCSAEEIGDIHGSITAYLIGQGEMPDQWPQLDELAAARGYPARHAAILLPYKALLSAFDKLCSAHPA